MSHNLRFFGRPLAVINSRQSVDRQVFIDQRPVNAVSGRLYLVYISLSGCGIQEYGRYIANLKPPDVAVDCQDHFVAIKMKIAYVVMPSHL